MVVYEYGVFSGVNKVKTLVDTYVADKFFPEGEQLYRVVDDKVVGIVDTSGEFYLDVIEDVKYTPHDYNLEKVLIGELQEIISNQDVRQDYLNVVSVLTSKLPETQRNGTTPIRTLLGLLESLT